MKFFTKAVITAAIALGTMNSAWAGAALDKVMKDGKLTVATDAVWPPQSFMNDNNEMDGFDVDVAKDIAKRLGVDVEFVTPAWEAITAGNWHGRWDISVGSMTPTKSRAEVLSFPAIYYYTPASVAVHNDSKVTKPADLSGKKVGAATATTYELYLQHDLVIDAVGAPEFTYQITPGSIHSMRDAVNILDDMRLGDGVRVDGIVDSLGALTEAKKNGYPIRIVGSPVFYEPLSVAIDKGDDEFDAKLAGIVKDMHADGTLSKLSMKWYGIDYSKQD